MFFGKMSKVLLGEYLVHMGKNRASKGEQTATGHEYTPKGNYPHSPFENVHIRNEPILQILNRGLPFHPLKQP